MIIEMIHQRYENVLKKMPIALHFIFHIHISSKEFCLFPFRVA